LQAVAEWFSIEVIDGGFSAGSWADGYGDELIWAAQELGISDWSWARHSWGVVLEIELPDELAWEQYLASPAVRAALDAVPDPVHGLITYKGRGGSAGSRNPRKPRPLIGAGAAALPLPERFDELDDWFVPEPARVMITR
jgi:hypothetical protein